MDMINEENTRKWIISLKETLRVIDAKLNELRETPKPTLVAKLRGWLRKWYLNRKSEYYRSLLRMNESRLEEYSSDE